MNYADKDKTQLHKVLQDGLRAATNHRQYRPYPDEPLPGSKYPAALNYTMRYMRGEYVDAAMVDVPKAVQADTEYELGCYANKVMTSVSALDFDHCRQIY
jgi:hypothetical protein